MTHRIDFRDEGQNSLILFQGLLNRTAFEELKEHCRTRARAGFRVSLHFGTGTAIETDLIEELVGLEGVALEAESKFLARWIENCQKARAPRR